MDKRAIASFTATLGRENMKKRNGYSLIELMVVVVIIGLLISMAYPVYNTYIAKVKISEFKKVLSSAITLYQNYYQEHDTFVTPTGDIAGGNSDIGFELSNSESSRFDYSSKEGPDFVIVTARLKKNIGKYKKDDGADLNQSMERNTVTKDIPW